MSEFEFNKPPVCWCCGKRAFLKEDGVYRCLKHPLKQNQREKIGDYSGKSQTPYGAYQDR